MHCSWRRLGILSYWIESWAVPVIVLLIYPSVWIESSSFVSASVQFHDISFHNVDNHVFQRFFFMWTIGSVHTWPLNTKKCLWKTCNHERTYCHSIQQKHAFFLCNYTNFLLQINVALCGIAFEQRFSQHNYQVKQSSNKQNMMCYAWQYPP